MANIDNVQLPDGSSYNIVDNTSGFATQNYVDSAVSSVTKTTIGLGNVDNTSDLNKPISTATQTALDTLDEDKADKTDIAPIEDSSTASASHATGSQFYFNGQLVTATADINAGGTITLNGNCEPSESITAQIKSLDLGSKCMCLIGQTRNVIQANSSGTITFALPSGSGINILDYEVMSVLVLVGVNNADIVCYISTYSNNTVTIGYKTGNWTQNWSADIHILLVDKNDAIAVN